jgi:glutamate synthase domain-containing protein 3/thioredoxin reductase/NAD-dependent dihydropyrimidine dehydrogenase PreA subunit
VTVVINARGVYYRELNNAVRQQVQNGVRHIILKNVRGQRYIGAGLTEPDLLIEVEGIPGEDLGFCLGGPTVVVRGHGQNAAANTMDSGTIVIHGLAGDALAYGMRGGKLFVRDRVGYRVGIHMKEYRRQKPVVVVGATSGDFLGEYMAGGTLVVLNRHNENGGVVGQADKTLATGIHGGEIFIYNYSIPSYLPGIGAALAHPTKKDLGRLTSLVNEYCAHFGLEAKPLLDREAVKIVPAGSRPFGRFYYPSYPVHTGLIPEQAEKASPCEASCPVGIPTGRFLRHLRLGEAEQAAVLIDDYSPFRYSNCGFICPHLCMEGCSRGKVDFPVRTAELARLFRAAASPPQKEVPSGKKISIIGAGPAGLTAAWFLARAGHDVEIFEAAPRAGGKMYQVVSRRRLPAADLEQDLERIAALGVRYHFNVKVSAAEFSYILADSDHVVVAAGAHRPLIPPVKGKEHIRAGLEFLKSFNRGEKIMVGPRVVLTGGGDVAIDGIEALFELGINPENITVIDIKTPAARKEARRRWEAAGAAFRYPLFLQEASAEGVTAHDAGGRSVFLPGTPIAFISETPELDFLPPEIRAQLNRQGFFSAEGSCLTCNPRVSIIGDAAGLGLVAHSIAKARDCAKEVDAALRGIPYEPPAREAIRHQDLRLEWNTSLDSLDGVPVQEEHARCLHCGVCVQCDDCINACPRQARRRESDIFSVDLSQCGGCGSCAAACRGGVIRMIPR